MARKTVDISNQIQEIIKKGVTKEYLDTLYRGENFMSQNKIAEEINESFELDYVSLKYVKGLFESFGIQPWDESERRHAQKLKPVNIDNIDKKVKELESYGFPVSKIEEMYNNGDTKNEIIETVNYTAGRNVLHKISLRKIWEHYSLNSRTQSEDNIIRLTKANKTQRENLMKSASYGNGITREEAIRYYLAGNSLAQMYKIYGISPVTLSKILKEEGIEVKTQKNVTDVLKDLENSGIGREQFIEKYHVENLTVREMLEWLSTVTNDKITDRTFEKMVKILDIAKPIELSKHNRGKKSRDELSANLGKLKKAGFDSREALAKHYDKNKSLTKRKLAANLNDALGEDFFTVSWLEGHMDPLLDGDRLKGVSRVEKEFQIEILKMLETQEIKLNDLNTIKPYELDILIPDLNVAIEFNGNYWHSDKFLLRNHNMTSVEYHTMKKLLCKELGITLLYVWEFDWYENPSLILEALRNFVKSGEVDEILRKLEY